MIQGILILICILSDAINNIRIFFYNNIFWQVIIPQSLRLWTWIMYLYMGGIIKKVSKKYNLKWVAVSTFFMTILAICVQYYICNVATNVINSEYMYDNPIIIIWSILVFTMISEINIKEKLLRKIIIELRGCLITIYAIHYPIIEIVSRYRIFQSSIGEILCCIVVIFMSIIIGLILKRVPIINKLTKI